MLTAPCTHRIRRRKVMSVSALALATVALSLQFKKSSIEMLCGQPQRVPDLTDISGILATSVVLLRPSILPSLHTALMEANFIVDVSVA